MTGDGFAPGKQVDFFWTTVDGAYVTKIMPDNVEYHERKYEEKRVRLGSASADGQGRVKVAFTAPEDFGEVHDLYAVVDGRMSAAADFGSSAAQPSLPPKAPWERRSPSR